MTNEEARSLVDKYFKADGYVFPGGFEHRFEQYSSALLYSLIRHYRPKTFLEVGTWLGGSTILIHAALMKNVQKFLHIASEIAPDFAGRTAENCLRHIGRVPQLIGDITTNLDLLPKKIDFMFIDTNHDLQTTEWIVKNLFPRLTKGGIYSMHDWAVTDNDGVLNSKGGDGGNWGETDYLIQLIRDKKFPFKKLLWTYGNPMLENMTDVCETGFWINE